MAGLLIRNFPQIGVSLIKALRFWTVNTANLQFVDFTKESLDFP